MSNEPGNLPEGESASNDVVPLSRPVEANELDDGWGDEPLQARPVEEGTLVLTQTKDEQTKDEQTKDEQTKDEQTKDPGDPQQGPGALPDVLAAAAASDGLTVLPEAVETVSDESNATVVHPLEAKRLSSMLPPSLSPVVLSTEDGLSAAPPAESGQLAPPEPTEAKPNRKRPTSIVPSRRRSGKKLGAGYVLVPLIGLAAGIALIVLRPKSTAPDKTTSAQRTPIVAQIPAPIAVSLPAQPEQVAEQAALAPSAEPVVAAVVPPAASAVASASPIPSPAAASGDGFLNAFQQHAAKSNAKWAEAKRATSKSELGGADASKSGSAKPAAAKPAAPGQADPLDVLKRLEEARKSKK